MIDKVTGVNPNLFEDLKTWIEKENTGIGKSDNPYYELRKVYNKVMARNAELRLENSILKQELITREIGVSMDDMVSSYKHENQMLMENMLELQKSKKQLLWSFIVYGVIIILLLIAVIVWN